tara:strand:- start:1858 stop:2109 length:252 start_codon:yes stop_codon:yes gene_type:complete
MNPVHDEVDRLIKAMIAKSQESADPLQERETTEIAALVMQQSFPDISPTAPKSLISTHAKAVLMRGHLRHMAWKSSGVLDRVG